MILLTLLYYLSISSTLAIPTEHPPLFHAVSNFQSTFGREITPSNTRTIWNIIWSCFSTLFACAWIAIHPNIPALKDSRWKIFRRRMMIMAFALVAPEMVIMWAARQHRDARLLVKEFQIKGRPGWTKTHAFFLIMGGFTLYEQGKPLRVLEWRDLEALARAGRINWPDITEEEIKDKSNGDYLSKSIVVLQTTWFIVQFFARVAFKLTITELEVVTFAFSTLIGIIYYLWWDKPLDVRCSVPVHLIVQQTTGQATSDNVTDDDFSPENFCFCCHLPLDVLRTILQGEEALGRDQIGTDNLSLSFPPNFPSSRTTLQNSCSNFVPTPIQVTVNRPRGRTTSVNRKRFYPLVFQIFCQKYGTFVGLVYALTFLIAKIFFGDQFHAMMGEHTLTKTDTQKPNSHPFNPLRNGPLRVPTFYSYTAVPWDRFVFAIFVSIFFGATHSVAWSYEFSTSTERWGWRIMSTIISVAPLILLSIFTASRMKIVNLSSFILSFFRVGLSWVYITARIALLFFPLISLRALPPGAYVDFGWATIIPHI